MLAKSVPLISAANKELCSMNNARVIADRIQVNWFVIILEDMVFGPVCGLVLDSLCLCAFLVVLIDYP